MGAPARRTQSGWQTLTVAQLIQGGSQRHCAQAIACRDLPVTGQDQHLSVGLDVFNLKVKATRHLLRGGALAHCFHPVADRLKCDVGIRALDGGDDGGQAAVCFAPPGVVLHRLGQGTVADIRDQSSRESALPSGDESPAPFYRVVLS